MSKWFEDVFSELTGFPPFGWQSRLFELFVQADFDSCATCQLPTGLGKTSLLTLWLMALARNPTTVPRRLVYVVNRRTVVDQTTVEAEKLRRQLSKVPEVEQALLQLCSDVDEANENFCPLAISTLRGKFADNRQWTTDPCRPAIVSGTVDMIGSRLLFDGYRCGFKTKPLHAGLLGTDTLLIHDEAHLEPAFQSLCERIQHEQHSGRFPEYQSSRRFKVIALSATNRNADAIDSYREPFGLVPKDYTEPLVQKRVAAAKGIAFHEVDKETEIADRLIELAEAHRSGGQAILVFVRKIADLKKIVAQLAKGREKKLPTNITQLAGPMRGLERERLATGDPVFQRFLPSTSRNREVEPIDGTVYLVATSAGEVGVNISADHLIADLSSFESVAQRLGRVNRFGDGDAKVELVAAKSVVDADEGLLKPFELSLKRTWSVLKQLSVRDDGRMDGSSAALSELPATLVARAYSPAPEILPVDECLLDAWSLTTLSMPGAKHDVPGRPPIEDWLHGISDDDPPQTQVAWRREVQELSESTLSAQIRPLDLTRVLEAYPLKPHELLQDRTSRVYDSLRTLVVNFDKLADDQKNEDGLLVWLVDQKNVVTKHSLRKLADPEAKANDRKRLEMELAFRIIVLPEELGGLDQFGMFSGKYDAKVRHDVADECFTENGSRLRLRYRTNFSADDVGQIRKSMREVLKIRNSTNDETDGDSPESIWFVRRRDLDDESLSFVASERQLLGPHLASAEAYALQFVEKLELKNSESAAVVLAAKYHDLGKRRQLWQSGIGNHGYVGGDLNSTWAKSEFYQVPVNRHYRHEFGSLSDVLEMSDFQKLSDASQDLAMHLIAAHHGRARPHFPVDESFDPERNEGVTDEIATQCPIRFGRMQRKYGRWQLAWLESLVRSADYLASQRLVSEASVVLPAEGNVIL